MKERFEKIDKKKVIIGAIGVAAIIGVTATVIAKKKACEGYEIIDDSTEIDEQEN